MPSVLYKSLKLTPLLGLLSVLALAAAENAPKVGDETLFLDISKLKLGTLNDSEEKKKYLSTVSFEKQKIQANLLREVYKNAYKMYRRGDYEGAKSLATTILAIDPTFQDAKMILQASDKLNVKGSQAEQDMIEDDFRAGLELYRDGRILEAAGKWEDVVKLSPGNIKARYWLQNANKELAENDIRDGQRAYEQGRYREALDKLYNALLRDKTNPRLTRLIGNAETALRDEQANQSMQKAVSYYGQGRFDSAYAELKKVLEIQPGDPKALKLVDEVKGEIADAYSSSGKRLAAAKRYNEAIAEFNKAVDYGYDRTEAGQLIAKVREYMRRDEEEKQRKINLAKQEAEKARLQAVKEEEAEQKNRMIEDFSGASAGGISEENKRASQQHYLEGIRHFQNGNLEKAKEECMLSRQLNPNNSDADACVKRIDQMVGGQ